MNREEKTYGRPQSVSDHSIHMGLNACIVAVSDETPQVLVVRHDTSSPQANETTHGLPFGPFEPLKHRTLEIGLKSWVRQQTSLELGYVEQLYTFGDRARLEEPDEGNRGVSIGYLALTQSDKNNVETNNLWRDWYAYFPWEDWRENEPQIITQFIRPELEEWLQSATSPELVDLRRERIEVCFGSNGLTWDDEKVLERYELLYEAGLVFEAARDLSLKANPKLVSQSLSMQFDHRRILATAISRLRGKIKYRPVVFELMPDVFTLLELQRAVEALSGLRLHKQNFRRLVEGTGLVESTGDQSTQTGGRPAQLFRFRKEILRERPAAGVRVLNPRKR